MSDLLNKKCVPLAKGSPALDSSESENFLKQIPQWQFNENKTGITREFRFKNFHQTMAFVNALAWIAHQQDHHPDFEVGYNRCHVTISTHSVGGLSENDFICAAKIDHLLQ